MTTFDSKSPEEAAMVPFYVLLHINCMYIEQDKDSDQLRNFKKIILFLLSVLHKVQLGPPHQ